MFWISSTVPIGRKGEKAEKVEGKRKELILFECLLSAGTTGTLKMLLHFISIMIFLGQW